MPKGRTAHIALVVLKLTVFLACLVVGYQYLSEHQANWQDLKVENERLWIVPVILILSGLNWCLEALKWQQLIRLIQEIQFSKALKATLSGVATSFITPFRVGDFVGRVLHLKHDKKRASVLTFYGNFTQLLSTMTFGLIGYSFLDKSILDINSNLQPILIILSSSLLILGWALAIFPSAWSEKIKLQDWLKFNSGLDLIQVKVAITSSVISLSRYLVFLLQFVLAYWLFGAKSDPFVLAALITLVYLLITFIPSPVLGKLGVRESVSLYVLASYEASEVILAASLLIWLFNLFIPAIVGAFFLLKTRPSSS